MQQQLVINNLLISYEQTGEGEKALLFLHGWRSSKEVWASIVHHVVKLLSYKVVAIDMPGFGKSEIPKTPMTVADYAEVVAEFIKKLDLKNITIIGHSFGGRVGIKLAAHYPQLISKLVLVDSAGFAMSTDKKSLMNSAAKIAKPFFKPKFMQGLRKKIYKQIGSEDYLATPELRQTYISIIDEDLSEDMKKIVCPTLIVVGENDNDTPVEFGRRMNSLIPNSKFHILSNAGHFSFLDKPQEFTKSLVEFI